MGEVGGKVVMEYSVYFLVMDKYKMWKLTSRQRYIQFTLAQIPRNNWRM